MARIDELHDEEASDVGFARRVFLRPRARRPTSAEIVALRGLAVTMAPFAAHIRRITVRLGEPTDERADRPHAGERKRGGTSTEAICRVHVALLDEYDVPSFLVEGRGLAEGEAAELAGEAAIRALVSVLRDIEELASERPPRRRRRR